MSSALSLPPLVPEIDLRGARGDFLEAIRRGHESYGDLFRLRFGRNGLYIVCHPDTAYEVLVRRKNLFAKLGAGSAKTGLARVLGEGLLTNTDTESWFTQRRILQPFFHRAAIARWGRICTETAERNLEKWRGSGASVMDVAESILELVGEIMMQIVFSAGPEDGSPLKVPLNAATDSAKKVRALNAQLDKQVYTLIKRRRREREQGKKFGDILELLLDAQDADTGAMLSDRQVRDELLTLFAAGHETTAHALAWAFYVIAAAPDEAARLRGELNKVLGERLPSVNDLADLPYTKAVFQEGLRLYPTIPSAPRVVLEACSLGGYTLPKGAKVFVSIYAIHRHPDFWIEPNTFCPERFLEGAAQRAYMPFGLGGRVCIGQHLALLIGQLVLASLTKQLELELLPEKVQPKVSISLGTRYGMNMRLKWLAP